MELSLNGSLYNLFNKSLTGEILVLENELSQIRDIKKNLEQKQQEKENLTSAGGFRQSKKSKRKSNKTKNVKRLRSRRNKK